MGGREFRLDRLIHLLVALGANSTENWARVH